ncbi:DEAD/DEAH box helicase [Candidatus Bathyarchaeota archaeon]|nr:DEAD/DEAH box helicase [Candidatus Bathyarchaeota archaeon]
MIILRFKRGEIKVEGGNLYLNNLEPDDIFPAYKYNEILKKLDSQKIKYIDKVVRSYEPLKINSNIKLRNYQSEALEEWIKNYNRGIVVLPTGAGKTYLAIKAIERLKVSTLIVVPTIVLLEQWRELLEDHLRTPIGAIGGGQNELSSITVSTYDSASIRSRNLGNIFELIIFDEVHHMPAPSYRKIATRYIAPYRLGLTATLQSDEAHELLFDELIGPKVYSLDVDDLAGEHLAEFEVKTIKVPLTGEEANEYNRQYGIYRKYLRKNNIRIRSSRDYVRLIKRSGRDPNARRAFMARKRAMDIALNSQNKVAYLKSLIKQHHDDKALIFTSQNKLVYRLSKDLLIPAITHQTPPEEREGILGKFKMGDYRQILTSRVLDEGIDVPDANIGVIISGTGSKRQFVQRLGRILRKTPDKKAVLYELVSAGTAETYISHRRKK